MEAELQNKSDNYIQLKKDESILRFGIRDENGNDTGEFLTFNLQDIELPIRYQELIEKDKQNRLSIKNQFDIIDKKQDHKGKKLLSANQEAKIKAMNNFYEKEIEVYNMFLGEKGVQKLLNGRQLSWGTFDEIDDIINDFILPKLKLNAQNIKEQIMQKYKAKEDGVIE